VASAAIPKIPPFPLLSLHFKVFWLRLRGLRNTEWTVLMFKNPCPECEFLLNSTGRLCKKRWITRKTWGKSTEVAISVIPIRIWDFCNSIFPNRPSADHIRPASSPREMSLLSCLPRVGSLGRGYWIDLGHVILMKALAAALIVSVKVQAFARSSKMPLSPLCAANQIPTRP
jgi:hypothetical protein